MGIGKVPVPAGVGTWRPAGGLREGLRGGGPWEGALKSMGIFQIYQARKSRKMITVPYERRLIRRIVEVAQNWGKQYFHLNVVCETLQKPGYCGMLERRPFLRIDRVA